jgi:cytochrome d ubiquinol oxidase subunit II
MVTGISLGADKEFAGHFWDLLNPYALMVGVTTLALFLMHGTIYATMKTEGILQETLKNFINNTIIFFVIAYVTVTNATLIYYPSMSKHFIDYPIFFIVAILNMLAIANIPREIHHNREFRAFLSSSASIVSLIALFAIGIFPNMVLSNPNPEFSLTIYNAASSQKTLGIMLIIAIIGIPFVLAYTISIYWVFRGKVKLESHSY